ncbi:hypothetical protein FRC05_003483 [Tulasnella sp. 425]|nr:hypothetical protein FRC05_003483 [Tulasnella sp. 425]
MDSKPSQFSDRSAHVSDSSESEPPTGVSRAFSEKIAPGPTQLWTTRPNRPRLLGLLPAAVVIVTTLGFVAGILGVLLVKQCEETQGGRGIGPAITDGVFYVFEDHNQGDSYKTRLVVVTLSNVANQVVSTTSSIVMALVAYRVGAEWIRLSRDQSGTNAAETPSPAQYGLLVRLLGSSSIGSILEAFVYTARSRNRARLPRMLRYSMWMATAVWVLARLVGLADTWLHVASYTRPSNITRDDSSPGPTPRWGVELNTSICDDMKAKYPTQLADDTVDLGCLLPYEYFVVWEDWGHAMGFDAMTNSTNATFHVNTVEGDIAFVLPGPKVLDMRSKNFLIPTFATQASCTSLNQVCGVPNGAPNCTSAGYPSDFPYYQNSTLVNRVLGVVGGELVGREIGTLEAINFPNTPIQLAIQLQWNDLEQGVGSGINPLPSTSEEDLAVDGNPPTLLAGCNLEFFDAWVQWNSTEQDWQLVNTTTSSQNTSRTLFQPIVWQYGTEQLAASLMYTARRDFKEEVMRTLGQNLATLTLATAAGFYRPHEAFHVSTTMTITVSVYPTPPVMTLLVLLCAYAALVWWILLSSYRTPDEAIIFPESDHGLQDEEMEPSTLTLAQRWLTHPLPLVGHSFSRQDGQDGGQEIPLGAHVLSSPYNIEVNSPLEPTCM